MTDPEVSSALSDFSREYFDSSSRLRGARPNAEVLLRLNDGDRAKAEKMLVDSLDPNAIYAIDALGFFKSECAIPALKKLLRKATGTSRVHAARALWDICMYDTSIDILCSIASKRGLFNRDARERAIGFLSDIDDDRVVDCLAGSLQSKKYGSLAIRTLARVLGASDALARRDTAMGKGREAFLIADKNLRDEVHRLLHESRERKAQT